MEKKKSTERYYSIKLKKEDPIAKKLEKIVNKYNVSINAAFKIYLTDLELKTISQNTAKLNEEIKLESNNKIAEVEVQSENRVIDNLQIAQPVKLHVESDTPKKAENIVTTGKPSKKNAFKSMMG